MGSCTNYQQWTTTVHNCKQLSIKNLCITPTFEQFLNQLLLHCDLAPAGTICALCLLAST
jgi:hypothetical protein